MVLLLALSVVNPGLAQKPPEPSAKSFIVATRVIPPFVFANKGELSGFSIDLWRSIASKLGIESKFVEYSTVPDLLSAVKNSKANVGIAAISITAERQESFDFSLPMFAAGLQIMVRPPQANGSAFSNILQLLFSTTLLQVFGIALLLVVVAAHVIWLSERNHKEGIIDKSYPTANKLIVHCLVSERMALINRFMISGSMQKNLKLYKMPPSGMASQALLHRCINASCSWFRSPEIVRGLCSVLL